MSRNFGTGSRNMADAGRMVLNAKHHGGFQTKYDIGQRWSYFSKWAAEKGFRKMETITRELVIQYGQELQADIDNGKRKGSSSAKNYISAINTVMGLATNQQWQTVKPGADCKIQQRSYIAEETKAITKEEHEQALTLVDERTASLMELQQHFGLRFKESALLNAKTALKQAIKYGIIKLSAGTKGGRKRNIPCRPHSISLLEKAASIQNGRSMIPKDKSYKEFQDECYRQAALAGINFHSERHFYAQQRYKEITQALCPVAASWQRKERLSKLAQYLNISEHQARELDESARLEISKELGHNRKEITDAYLG